MSAEGCKPLPATAAPAVARTSQATPPRAADARDEFPDSPVKGSRNVSCNASIARSESIATHDAVRPVLVVRNRKVASHVGGRLGGSVGGSI